MKVKITCEFCGVGSFKEAGQVNRAKRSGNAVYCGRECSGMARRSYKPYSQRKAEKREYDIEYRRRNAARRAAQKKEYHKSTYDPIQAAIMRRKRMPKHVEYCRRPEYKTRKRQYDRKRRADKNYGPFAECFILLMDLAREISERATNYEIRLQNGTLNKSQKRRRAYVELNGC